MKRTPDNVDATGFLNASKEQPVTPQTAGLSSLGMKPRTFPLNIMPHLFDTVEQAKKYAKGQKLSLHDYILQALIEKVGRDSNG